MTGSAPGSVISRVGNTGRATNDHLHLELAASPTDSMGAIVDSLQRFPPYTTNPELWIEPLPGTGIVAGQVLDCDRPPGAAGADLRPREAESPAETPFSYAETYGDKAHSHPLYGEHFAVGDVPAGTYVIGTEIGESRCSAGDGRGGEAHLGRLHALMFIELTDHLRCPADHEESFSRAPAR